MNYFFYVTLFFYASIALGQGLTVDIEGVRFLGGHCKNMSAQNVKIDDQDRLIIDLTPLDNVPAQRTKKGCLIKIPYTGSLNRNSILLEGEYQLAHAAQFLASWGVGSQGQLARAKTYNLLESPGGKFSWEEAIELKEEQGEAKWLRISLFFDLKPQAGKTKLSAANASQIRLHQIVLKRVKAKVKV